MNRKTLLQTSAILVALAFSWACGGSKSTESNNNTGGGGSTAANSVALTVGPGSFANGYDNAPYATVTICQPGTSNCTSIDHVLVDTGSSGLRILASELPSGFTLTPESATGGSLYECLPFLDSYSWGNVVTADVELAGEKASSVPVHLITGATAPTECSSVLVATPGSPPADTEAELGARGILGVGNLTADCGAYCETKESMDIYFSCSSSAPTSCTQVGVPITQQVTNPVALFASDNNGVAVQLASVPEGGAASAAGTLYFGVGTQSDNTPASGLTVLALNDLGNIGTTFQSKSLPDSFVDSGSNGLFFGTINTSTLVTSTGITGCNLGTTAEPNYWYCPSSELSETATMSSGSASKSVSFSVGNANTLSGEAFSDLAGPNTTDIPDASTSFDWGIPFFFGRTVYIGLEGSNSSLGSNAYVAF
jgi:hypothetical protein